MKYTQIFAFIAVWLTVAIIAAVRSNRLVHYAGAVGAVFGIWLIEQGTVPEYQRLYAQDYLLSSTLWYLQGAVAGALLFIGVSYAIRVAVKLVSGERTVASQDAIASSDP